MIDNPRQVFGLLSELREALPVGASMTQELATVVCKETGAAEVPRACRIVGIEYAGDPGGIMCKLELDGIERAFIVSITHLAFRGGTPLSRKIADYQKRRTKRISREALQWDGPTA